MTWYSGLDPWVRFWIYYGIAGMAGVLLVTGLIYWLTKES